MQSRTDPTRRTPRAARAALRARACRSARSPRGRKRERPRGRTCIGSSPMQPPFKFSARTRVGFSDTDAQGVVYYGRYNPYFDLARVEYLRSLGLLHRHGSGDFVMRANDVEYFAPARFDDELDIYARVARLGTTSVTFAFAAY